MSSKEKLNTIFLATYFKDINEVSGGYGERVFGLYGTYAKKYNNADHNIYIWTEKDKKIIQCLGENFIEIKKGCSFIGLINFIFSKTNCRLILSWPQVKLSTVLISLLAKKLKNHPFILDLHDLPLEQSLAFGSEVSRWKRFILATYTKFIFHHADYLFSVSNAFTEYICVTYQVEEQKVRIAPNGTFPELLHSHREEDNQNGTKICYTGSLLQDKGVPELIKLVDDLRSIRKDVRLELWGHNGMGIKSNDWLTVSSASFSQMKDILGGADVLIIPFPKKFYYDIAHPIKLSDYMAVGRPIVCLNLETSGTIIHKYQCGMVCNDYKEMHEALLKLIDDKQLRQELGANGYNAAKTYYDWTIIAQSVHEFLGILRE
jgi:glycosyltransferase involved in cell wall biosynthesis